MADFVVGSEESPDSVKGQVPGTSGSGRAASALGADALVSRRAAAGSDEMRAGMEWFLEEVRRRALTDAAQAKGHLAEKIWAAKFNTDAANKGIDLGKHGLDAPGDNNPIFDLKSRDGNHKYQAKTGDYARKKGTWGKEKYDDVRKVTTKDHADPRHGIEGEVAHGGASASVTEGELQFARENPKVYAAFQEMKQVGHEAAVTGGVAAASGAIFGAATSSVANLWALHQGKISGQKAAEQIGKDAIVSAARGGAAGAGSAVVRHVGDKAGIGALTKTNVAAAVASGVIDVSSTVLSWVKGDISAEEAAIRLGDTGCGALSGIYGGAAAGAIFGPAGAVVGSAVGYLLSACVYQSCVATFQEARLAEEEAERVVALCAEAVSRMDEQRRQFEQYAKGRLEARQQVFDRHLERIDAALHHAGGDGEKLRDSLSQFALSFGKKLRHVDPEDFRRFVGSKGPAVL